MPDKSAPPLWHEVKCNARVCPDNDKQGGCSSLRLGDVMVIGMAGQCERLTEYINGTKGGGK